MTATADEYLDVGYRLRWDLLVAPYVILLALAVYNSWSGDSGFESVAVVLATASLPGLYWNVYAAFETDQLMTSGQRARALTTSALLLVPLVLQSRLDQPWAIGVIALAWVVFVALSERGRRTGIRLRAPARPVG